MTLAVDKIDECGLSNTACRAVVSGPAGPAMAGPVFGPYQIFI